MRMRIVEIGVAFSSTTTISHGVADMQVMPDGVVSNDGRREESEIWGEEPRPAAALEL